MSPTALPSKLNVNYFGIGDSEYSEPLSTPQDIKRIPTSTPLAMGLGAYFGSF